MTSLLRKPDSNDFVFCNYWALCAVALALPEAPPPLGEFEQAVYLPRRRTRTRVHDRTPCRRRPRARRQ